MSGRMLLTAAALVYVAVLGCVLLPGQDSGNHVAPNVPHLSSGAPIAGLPYRGCCIQIQRVDWMDEYKKCIDEISAISADTVLFVVDSRQENGESNQIYLDMRMTPTPEQLGGLIDHAKARHLRVVLMPIVLLDRPVGNQWRGSIRPKSWEDWFESYHAMITHFAYIAEGHHADVLVVGSELVTSEDKVDMWTRNIEDVRAIFKGQLTYSANWDHYASVPFWNQLDLFSMNSYWKLGPDNKVTVPEITANWRKIQKDVLEFQKKIDKPLMFTEVGWCSLANSAHEPWDYTKVTVPIDDDLQKRLYQGFFDAWQGNPGLGGFMIWEWAPGEGGKGTENEKRGYTPENKPAEAVLREYLAKPWTPEK